jgi:hypothetical protein
LRKYVPALRKISFAWRSSRTSRSSALMRSLSSVAAPVRGAIRTMLQHHPDGALTKLSCENFGHALFCSITPSLAGKEHRANPAVQGN